MISISLKNCVSLQSRMSALYFERRFLFSAFGLFQQQIQEVRQSPEQNVTHCTWMVQQRIHCHCHEAETPCTLGLTASQSFSFLEAVSGWHERDMMLLLLFAGFFLQHHFHKRLYGHGYFASISGFADRFHVEDTTT